MKILSVDDVLVIRKLIKKVVEGMGGTLLEASSGHEAFEIITKSKEQVDLILLDWNMPNMDGFEFLKKFKSNIAYKNIPVIMVTNNSEKEKIIKAIQAGASNYLAKPFTEQDLTKKIVECLGLGYESLLTKCISSAVNEVLRSISGTEIVESNINEKEIIIPKSSFFGQMLFCGQKNAIVFTSIKKDNATKLFSFIKNNSELSNSDLIDAFIELLDMISAKAKTLLSVASSRVELSSQFLFSGYIEESRHVYNMKNLTALKRFSSGGMEVDLKIIYL